MDAGEVGAGQQPVAQARIGHGAQNTVDLIRRELDAPGDAAVEIAGAQPNKLGHVLQFHVLLGDQNMAKEGREGLPARL
jgi:hypothetical protein